MSPTPIKDPNAPPDPTELRDIPDYQMPADGWMGEAHNPVPPGAPPSPDYPTGVPPEGVPPDQGGPIEPPPDGGGGGGRPPPRTAKDEPAKKK